MSPIYWSWKNIRGSLRRIWQNLTWGWNESDIWGLDHTIAAFVLPRIKLLKKEKVGCPILDGYESDDPDNKNFEEMHKEWDGILDKMIQTFEWILLDDDDISKECEKKEPCFYLPFKFIPCNDGSGNSYMEYDATPEQIKKHEIIFKEYMDKCKKRREDIQVGLNLFAKYFQSLWD